MTRHNMLVLFLIWCWACSPFWCKINKYKNLEGKYSHKWRRFNFSLSIQHSLWLWTKRNPKCFISVENPSVRLEAKKMFFKCSNFSQPFVEKDARGKGKESDWMCLRKNHKFPQTFNYHVIQFRSWSPTAQRSLFFVKFKFHDCSRFSGQFNIFRAINIHFLL